MMEEDPSCEPDAEKNRCFGSPLLGVMIRGEVGESKVCTFRDWSQEQKRFHCSDVFTPEAEITAEA